MANRTKRTDAREEKFLDALAEGRSIGAAANLAGVGRRTVYEWRKEDPDFEERWDEAYAMGTDVYEDELRRRALEGTDRPVFYKGEECGAITEFSDNLLVRALEARDPDKWRPQREIMGKGGGAIQGAVTFRWAKDEKEAEDGGGDPVLPKAASTSDPRES